MKSLTKSLPSKTLSLIFVLLMNNCTSSSLANA
nr:MAG TPA: hypothetical protein [Caudoviricetes sp.]